MDKKPARRAELLKVQYDKQHWQLLRKLRSQAVKTMEILHRFNLPAITHGSVARGDVSPTSDVDVFIENPPSSFVVEAALEREAIRMRRRFIVQATPFYAVKGYIEIDELQTISFPLVRMRQVERGFYRFSGTVDLQTLKEDKRVLGVDKRLMLIEPTCDGHIESAVVNREEEVSKLLRLPAKTVLDRVHALLRRDKVGRTGVFIKRELAMNEGFEMALKRLADTKPEVKRRLKL